MARRALLRPRPAPAGRGRRRLRLRRACPSGWGEDPAWPGAPRPLAAPPPPRPGGGMGLSGWEGGGREREGGPGGGAQGGGGAPAAGRLGTPRIAPAPPWGRASAAMRGCSPRPKHASVENGTWSHGLVASRHIEWQQESSGRFPFPRACLLCKVHIRSGSCGCNSQIRVVMLEDLTVFCNEFIHVSHSILMLCKLQQI